MKVLNTQIIFMPHNAPKKDITIGNFIDSWDIPASMTVPRVGETVVYNELGENARTYAGTVEKVSHTATHWEPHDQAPVFRTTVWARSLS